MKTTLHFVWLIFVSLVSLNLAAQSDNSTRPSPPAEAAGKIGEAEVVIHYSAPAVKGRTIWGQLVPYGKVWRTGANEATTFKTSADIRIQGELLPAGRYALFTIPGETEWTFIFNSVPDQWGAYRYDESKDVLRVTAKPGVTDSFYERMSIQVNAGSMKLRWAQLEVGVDLTQGK